MRQRLRIILDLLLASDSWTPVHELARETGAGVRTVFRDVLELEYVLKPYGVEIEKKRGTGIRLVGDLSAVPRKGRPLHRRLPWLTADQRQVALVCFLGHERRVFKLSELARLFAVSDSCISGDLRDIEVHISQWTPGASLVRQKGIGVSLEGDEWSVRMAILHAAVRFMDPREIVRLVQPVPTHGETPTTSSGQISNQPSQTLRTLGYSCDHLAVFDAMRKTEKELGYRFSWYDQGLLFLYLLIANERQTDSDFYPPFLFVSTHFSIPARFSDVLLGRILSTVTASESSFLRAVLCALEPGELRESVRSHPDIPKILSSFIASLDQRRSIPLVFDRSLSPLLAANLSAVIYKKIFFLPAQSFEALQVRDDCIDIVQSIIFDLIPQISHVVGVTLTIEDLASFSLSIHSVDERSSLARKRLRVLVSCFEGFCLAQFISSLITAHFPELIVVAVRSCGCETAQGHVAEKIDFSITTFPSVSPEIPQFIVQLPFNADEFCRSLGLFLVEQDIQPKSIVAESLLPDTEELIDGALELLGTFSFTIIEHPIPEEKATREIAKIVLGDGLSAKRLGSDLDRREQYGEVILENSGIRLFHCRSRTVSSPRLGVIRSEKSLPAWVFMIAPDPASRRDITVLSRISVSLMDDIDFSRLIISGNSNEIKRSLYRLFAEII